ncbi:hypothetical protein HAP94_00390 [Acidithiobacillus ferrivorans]|nr:hypothetical protein [Acidithiobacillus ferrivorans]
MEMTKLEQQILNDEVMTFLDRDQSDLEDLWNQPEIAESCPPGVLPDTWITYLTDLREAKLDNDSEWMEILQEDRPTQGSDKNWQERQNERDGHRMNQIYAQDDSMSEMEVQEEETGQTPEALSAQREILKTMKKHQRLRNLLDEPQDLNRNRQMWRLESLLVEYGHQDDWETTLQALEMQEFQEQGLTMDDPEDGEVEDGEMTLED